jgi:hypothetical protein
LEPGPKVRRKWVDWRAHRKAAVFAAAACARRWI